MPNGLDAYFRAKGQAMRQGQNMLAAEQQMQGLQREQGLRDIISGAYEPGEGMNMQNALSAMYEGGYGPEAMKMEASQAKLRGATPSMVNEYKFWSQLPKADQEKYLQVKRAQKFLDIGEGFVAPSMVEPTVTKPVVTRKLKPTEKIPYITGKAEAAVTGKELGTEKALLANLEASLPNLQNVVGKLSALGKVATYTKAGQARDATARQLGFKVSEGAIARKEYISMVDNEILPLLKQTFGAAFTQKEGDTLKATLGDPDASPEEKEAVLRSFIEAKISQIQTKQRRVGQIPASPQDLNKQALNWANNNPNDPRAIKILQRLGR